MWVMDEFSVFVVLTVLEGSYRCVIRKFGCGESGLKVFVFSVG